MATDRPSETELLLDTPPGDVSGNQPSGTGEMPGVGFADFLRVIIVLLVIIALIYVFVWVLKRFTGPKSEGAAIRLYATRMLKGDAALHLVEAGKKIYLIGSSSSSVTLIAEIEDQESVDEIRLNASLSRPKASGGFAGLFKDRFNTVSSVSDSADQNAENTAPRETDPVSHLRKQRERLETL